MNIQGSYAAMGSGGAAGLASIEAMKHRMDAQLVSGDFSSWEACVVQFVGELSLATSGLIAPNFDLRGRSIQVLHDTADVMHSMSIASTTTIRGGAIVFGWERGSARIEQFIESLETYPRSQLASTIAQSIFAFVGNTYFSSSWWNGLNERCKQLIMYHASNTNAYYNRPEILNQDLVPWAITDVYRVRAP